MMDPENSFMKNAPEGSFGHTGFTGTSISVIPQIQYFSYPADQPPEYGAAQHGEYYNVNPVRQAVFQSVLKYSNQSFP